MASFISDSPDTPSVVLVDEKLEDEVAENLEVLEDVYLTLANPYLGRIFVVMVYTICDIAYILWIIHFRSRMGEKERGYVLKALLGFGDAMRIAFGINPKGQMGNAPGSSGRNN